MHKSPHQHTSPQLKKIKYPKTTFFFHSTDHIPHQMETLLISYDYIRQVITQAQIKMRLFVSYSQLD